MSSHPRDSKRQRVYDAERELPEFHQKMDWPEVEAFFAQVNASRWFRARWSTVVRPVRKRGGSAYGYPGGRVTLPAFARNRIVILHEIAHTVTYADQRYAPHGPEYCGVFVALVGHFVSDDVARRLRAELRARKVAVKGTLLPEPVRPVTSLTEVRKRRASQQRQPLSDRERADLAELLRRAAVSGEFGAAGTRLRTQALALARAVRAEVAASKDL